MSSKPQPPFQPQDMEPPGLEKNMHPQPRFGAPDYKPSGKLKGMISLITGGDSGIGRAVAELFAREGADVALVYLAEEQQDADTTRRAIESHGQRALLIPGDVSSEEFCQSAITRVLSEFERLDILVNNAAYQKHQDSIEDVSAEQWKLAFNTNVLGYFLMAKYALPHIPSGGVIINTGSITGLEGSPGLLDYASTKGAIHAFTKSLAKNVIGRGIRVNCVAPGPVWTPLNPAERSNEEIKEFGASTPMGRPAQPEEIAPSFVYFASSADSGYVSGHVLPLLGGGTIAG